MSTTLLVQKIASQLRAKQYQLVTAESCTGGLLAKILTDQAGSSQWFERGFVTYSTWSKCELLAVNISTLEQYGAVSAAVASEMAEGALKNSRAQLSIAITGLAGPSGDLTALPIGTVWFAWAGKQISTQSKVQQFNGNRATIRNQAVLFALQELARILCLKERT